MQFQISSQTTVDVPAAQAWHVLAHQFDQIGQWTSLIPQSQPVSDIPPPTGRWCASGSRPGTARPPG